MIDHLKLPEDTPVRPLRAVRDMAGLSVQDASGLHVGSIWGALADQETGLIRYLDVSLSDRPRHVLVPIGHARVYAQDLGTGYDTERDTEVRLRAALLEELNDIPTFDPESTVDEALEREVLGAHGRLFHGERYYAHPAFDHRGLYAGEHPIARDADAAQPDDGLQPLRTLPGYRVARGETDVRGWKVVGANGDLGAVSDLVVDTANEQVRYLVIAHDSRRALLPIGFLHIDSRAERVLAPGVTPEDVARLPEYDGQPVDRVVEQQVRSALEEGFAGPRRYQLPDFNPRTTV